MLRSRCSTLTVWAPDISSKSMRRMWVNVIFSIVYRMHFIWYFIVEIARSRQIRCLNRLSSRGFAPKRIFLHFSNDCFSFNHLTLSFSLFPSFSSQHLFAIRIVHFWNRDHTQTTFTRFPYSIILLYAICINTTQSKINQAKPNWINSINIDNEMLQRALQLKQN